MVNAICISDIVVSSAGKTFQLDYLYRACHPGIKEQIVNLAMNNAGIHDTAKAYKHQCCCTCFKKLSPRCVNPNYGLREVPSYE